LLHLSAAVWELFTGTLAFKNLHYGAVVQRVVVAGQRPPIPEVAPEEYCLLMTRWNPTGQLGPSLLHLCCWLFWQNCSQLGFA